MKKNEIEQTAGEPGTACRHQTGPAGNEAGPRRKTGLAGEKLTFSFNGRSVDGMAGDSVAAALLAAGYTTLRESPRAGTPRGPFCWMGVCQECTVVIDGVRRPACRTSLTAGMRIFPGTIA